jgi:Mlc titration factor MtfA (ptsG expression regulator)
LACPFCLSAQALRESAKYHGAMFGFFTRRRRRGLRAQPTPGEWRGILKRCVPLFARLNAVDQEELTGHMKVFLAEKNFEGCAGLLITAEMRVTVAAQACMLLLHRETDYFPRMGAILMYPAAFLVKHTQHDEHGFEEQVEQENAGEAWERGSVILSWEDVQLDSEDPDDGFNVVLHEFAHQLDMEDGEANGVPVLERREDYKAWKPVMEAEFARLTEFADWAEEHEHNLLAHHREDREPMHEAFENNRWRHPKLGRLGAKHQPFHVMDPYGAEDPAEFFAVATEAFFEDAKDLKEHHPSLYAQLQGYYKQDPAGWA